VASTLMYVSFSLSPTRPVCRTFENDVKRHSRCNQTTTESLWRATGAVASMVRRALCPSKSCRRHALLLSKR
jgi:hypothetical protein